MKNVNLMIFYSLLAFGTLFWICTGKVYAQTLANPGLKYELRAFDAINNGPVTPNTTVIQLVLEIENMTNTGYSQLGITPTVYGLKDASNNDYGTVKLTNPNTESATITAFGNAIVPLTTIFNLSDLPNNVPLPLTVPIIASVEFDLTLSPAGQAYDIRVSSMIIPNQLYSNLLSGNGSTSSSNTNSSSSNSSSSTTSNNNTAGSDTGSSDNGSTSIGFMSNRNILGTFTGPGDQNIGFIEVSPLSGEGNSTSITNGRTLLGVLANPAQTQAVYHIWSTKTGDAATCAANRPLVGKVTGPQDGAVGFNLCRLGPTDMGHITGVTNGLTLTSLLMSNGQVDYHGWTGTGTNSGQGTTSQMRTQIAIITNSTNARLAFNEMTPLDGEGATTNLTSGRTLQGVLYNAGGTTVAYHVWSAKSTDKGCAGNRSIVGIVTGPQDGGIGFNMCSPNGTSDGNNPTTLTQGYSIDAVLMSNGAVDYHVWQ